MTINILFLSITFNKRKYSKSELESDMSIRKISDRIMDRKCELHKYI
jgi:uncharacterized protein (TIGR02413 family)